MDQQFDGVLLIDKPKDWSSFDVVAKIRGTLKRATGRKIKVGHTGTLDPLATGMMIVVVGSYCKRAQEFSKLDKTYQVTMKLGQTSTTGDEEGEKTTVGDRQPVMAEISDVLIAFTGTIMQTPPIYSAIKVGGKRAYKLAREGKEVVIEPRAVQVYNSVCESYDYPYVHFTTRVGSGTYIRSLVDDIGKQLGTGAYMSNLKRTSVGTYELNKDACLNPEVVSAEQIYSALLS